MDTQPSQQSSRTIRQQEVQFRVMQAIAARPNITQRELAETLGVSLGRAHYCLAALLKLGWVKIERFRSSDTKSQYAYILTPTGVAQKAAVTGQFLQRKIEEYEALRRVIEGLREDLEIIDGTKDAY